MEADAPVVRTNPSIHPSTHPPTYPPTHPSRIHPRRRPSPFTNPPIHHTTPNQKAPIVQGGGGFDLPMDLFIPAMLVSPSLQDAFFEVRTLFGRRVVRVLVREGMYVCLVDAPNTPPFPSLSHTLTHNPQQPPTSTTQATAAASNDNDKNEEEGEETMTTTKGHRRASSVPATEAQAQAQQQ